MTLSFDQTQLLDLFVKIGALIGMVGEISTLGMFLTNPQEFYSPMGHLVLALCGADILGSIGKGIGRFGIQAGAANETGETNSILCLSQAAMIIEADDITITIIFMMTWMVVYLTFFTTKYEPLSKSNEIAIIIIAVLLPFPPIIWILFGPGWIGSEEPIIGDALNWCSIRPMYFWTYQFIIYYFWQWGLFIFNLLSITAVYWRLSTMAKQQSDQK
jgi:hypothetical protein